MSTKLDKRKPREKRVFTAALLAEVEAYWKANPKKTIKQTATHFGVKESGLLWAVNYDEKWRKMYETVISLRETVLDDILWDTAISPPDEDKFPVNANRAQVQLRSILNRTKAARTAVHVNSAGPMTVTVKYADPMDDLCEPGENGD